jgi:hypothetical protein
MLRIAHLRQKRRIRSLIFGKRAWWRQLESLCSWPAAITDAIGVGTVGSACAASDPAQNPAERQVTGTHMHMQQTHIA